MKTRWRVAVIDDEKAIGSMLTAYLSHDGYEVYDHESREQALAALEERAADLILMDLMMPGMGPADFLAHVRRKFPYVPVVLMSGHPDVFEHASKLGLSYVVRKPIAFSALSARIAQVLGGRTQAFLESVKA